MTELINPSDGPAMMERRLRAIEERLKAMETARNAGLSTIAGGTLRVADDIDGTLAQFGAFEVESWDTGETVGRTGINVVDPDTGHVIFRSSVEDGFTKPEVGFGWVGFDDMWRTTTSATFDPLWITRGALWPSSGLFTYSSIAIVGGTASWEARLKIATNAIGTAYSGVIAGSTGKSIVWRLDLAALGYDRVTDFGIRVDLEVRRVSGTGTLWCELPYPITTYDATVRPASADGISETP